MQGQLSLLFHDKHIRTIIYLFIIFNLQLQFLILFLLIVLYVKRLTAVLLTWRYTNKLHY